MDEEQSLAASKKTAKTLASSDHASYRSEAHSTQSRYSQATQRTSRPQSKTLSLSLAPPQRGQDAEPLPLGDVRRPHVKPSLMTRIAGGDRLHSHHHNVEKRLDGKTNFVIRSSKRASLCHYALVTAAPIQYAEEGHADRYLVKFLSGDKRANVEPGDEKEMSHHELAEAAYGPCSRLGPPFSHQTYFRLQRHVYEVKSDAVDEEGDKADEGSTVKIGKVRRSRFVYERHFRQAFYPSFHNPKWVWHMQIVTPEMMVPPAPSMYQSAAMVERQRPSTPRLPSSPMQATPMMQSPVQQSPSIVRSPTLASKSVASVKASTAKTGKGRSKTGDSWATVQTLR